MPKVSIIMPAYNAKQFLDDSINSVLSQTYQNWELIIVDDCSNDGTYNYILERYSENSQVKILQNSKNSGAGITRNTGLEYASGKLIAFLDADDIWLEDKLEKQVAYLKEHQCGIVHTSYSFINENGDKIAGKVNVSDYVDLQSYMRSTQIGMSTVLINKDLIGDFYFSSLRVHEDAQLWLDLLGKGYISKGINETLVLYRVRDGQISGNKIKAAWSTLKLYLAVKNLPIKDKLINFTYYAFNGIYKRLSK